MSATLPTHYRPGIAQVLFSVASIAAALGLLGWHAYRTVTSLPPNAWWVPIVVLAGVATADFLSGLVHWTADTWGRDEIPIIGRRFLVPFRVHHVNPDDFLRRGFVDTNGDVAFLAAMLLTAGLLIPIRSAWGSAAAMFLLGCCGVGMMTNQIHQWAHTPAPPRIVRMLQAYGVILDRAAHDRHHSHPYDESYCITTGWCNAPLARIDFFRRLERIITKMTGVAPRHDDARYEKRFGRHEVLDA